MATTESIPSKSRPLLVPFLCLTITVPPAALAANEVRVITGPRYTASGTFSIGECLAAIALLHLALFLLVRAILRN